MKKEIQKYRERDLFRARRETKVAIERSRKIKVGRSPPKRWKFANRKSRPSNASFFLFFSSWLRVTKPAFRLFNVQQGSERSRKKKRKKPGTEEDEIRSSFKFVGEEKVDEKENGKGNRYKRNDSPIECVFQQWLLLYARRYSFVRENIRTFVHRNSSRVHRALIARNILMFHWFKYISNIWIYRVARNALIFH